MKKEQYVNQEILDIAPITKKVVAASLEYKPIADMRNIVITGVMNCDMSTFYRWYAYMEHANICKMLSGMKSLKLKPKEMNYNPQKREINILVSTQGSTKDIWYGKEIDPLLKTEI